MLIKPKAIFIDVNGGQYKIKQVFPEAESFSYYFKDVDEWRYAYKGVQSFFLLEQYLDNKQIVPYGKASKVLYGKKYT